MSLLSGEVQDQNFNGLLNLTGIIMVVANCHVLIKKLREGLVFSGLRFSWEENRSIYLAGLSLMLWINLAVVIEKAALRFDISQRFITLLHGINSTVTILYPCVVAWNHPDSFTSTLILLFETTIVFLKLISYAACNGDLRDVWKAAPDISSHDDDDGGKKKAPKLGEQGYPKNLTFGNMW